MENTKEIPEKKEIQPFPLCILSTHRGRKIIIPGHCFVCLAGVCVLTWPGDVWLDTVDRMCTFIFP